jgi:hypothetical protein
LLGFGGLRCPSEVLTLRWADVLRTQLLRIIKRAGLAPWTKAFRNLRASRETELVASFPIHVVCAWIGNSQRIAVKHYLTVTEADFAQATGRAAESAAFALQKATVQQAADACTKWQKPMEVVQDSSLMQDGACCRKMMQDK